MRFTKTRVGKHERERYQELKNPTHEKGKGNPQNDGEGIS